MSAADVLVIGAGPNGLVAAGLLAKRGRRVIVLERREIAGGIAAPEEFHPGYRSAGLLHDTSGFRESVADALDLRKHGLRIRPRRADLLALDGGAGLVLSGDPEAAARTIEAHSPGDGERYGEYRALLRRLRPALAAFLDEPPVDLVDFEAAGVWALLRRALRVRRLGRADMMELLRLPPMSVADWLDEWFRSDLLKAALALPALAGNWLGPRSPASNANLLLWEAAAGPGLDGGAAGLAAALERAARAAGAEIRTGAEVEAILPGRDGVRGVRLAGGEILEAPAVAAACAPRHALLDLLPRGSLGLRLSRRLASFRTRGTTAQVLLALRAAPGFQGSEAPVEFARTGSCLDDLERAFDPVKYRRLPEAPVLDIHVPTVSAPELAPDGGAVLSALVHFVPYHVDGGWDDAKRRALGDAAVATLERHLPGLGSSIAGRQVLAPPDLEARYGLPGGHVLHGEHALDQLLIRPVPECSRYRTPIAGLYLCSGGSHPGGGLTGAPGALAAGVILEGRA